MKLYTFENDETGEILEQVRAESHAEAVAKASHKDIDRDTFFYSEPVED